MYERTLSEVLSPHCHGTARVALIRNASSPPPAWAVSAGFDLRILADNPDAAMSGTNEREVNALVVDVRSAAADVAGLVRLRARLGNPAILIEADGRHDEALTIVDALGSGASLLPAHAAPEVQAQIIAFAAECSRLTAALAERAAALEQRNHELEQSHARFHDIIEHNADAIVVVDREGVIRFANSVATRLFRTPREDLVGTPFGFPVVAGETTELDLLTSGAAAIAEMQVVESEWEGRPAFIASLREVTERKRLEADARRLIQERTARATAENAARRLRFLAEATTLLTLPLDIRETLSTLARLCVQELADWAVVYLAEPGGGVRRLEVAHRNPEKAALVQALRDDPIDPAGSHPALEVIRRRAPRLVTDIDETKLAGIAQSPRHLELIQALGVSSFLMVPMVARDRGVGAIGLVLDSLDRHFTEEDVTEAADLGLRAGLAVDNVRLLAEAHEANRAKSDLLAVISHDLRTPLNSIMGHTELLSLGIPDPLSAATLERVDRIRVSASHLVYLIDELLAFARLDSGREELHFEEVDATAVAAEVAAVVEPLAHERGLRFEAVLPGEALIIRTDPNRLRQILLNLTGNAIKYTHEGEVRFELRTTRRDRIEFVIRDTGVGIAAEHLDRIFEPFWQVDSTQRSANGGTGLGLSVVRGLARLLGGEVRVESELGRGSTFSADLPLRPPHEGE